MFGRALQRVTDLTRQVFRRNRFRIVETIISALALALLVLPCQVATGSPPSSPVASATIRRVLK
eukprot:3608343-Pleurochrysis_carterae.AAC.1